MDEATMRYVDNESVCYDGKEFLESLSKICRNKSVTGTLQTSESATIKTTS